MFGFGKKPKETTEKLQEPELHDPADNREVPRFPPSEVRANLSGSVMRIPNISANGLLVTDGMPEWAAPGQGVVFDLNLPGNDRMKSTTAQGRITRIDEDGVAVRYTSWEPNWERIMTGYLSKRA